MAPSPYTREPSAGTRTARSSSSSRTVEPVASTSRAPPVSDRRTGGPRTTLKTASSPGAELDVVDVLGDRRVLAADGAVCAPLDLPLGELGGKRVEQQEAPDERLADPRRELDRL